MLDEGLQLQPLCRRQRGNDFVVVRWCTLLFRVLRAGWGAGLGNFPLGSCWLFFCFSNICKSNHHKLVQAESLLEEDQAWW